MHRIAYRKILPAVQLALYLVLIWYGCLYRQTWQSQWQHWITSRPVAADEWIPTWVDGAPSFAEQLASGINAPAVFAATLILIPFDSLFHNGASHELAAHGATSIFVPLLWYLIGRRLERRRGVLTRPTMIGKVLMIGGLTAAALVAIFIVVSLAFRSDEMVAGRLLILSWAIGGILLSSKTILHWRIRAATS